MKTPEEKMAIKYGKVIRINRMYVFTPCPGWDSSFVGLNYMDTDRKATAEIVRLQDEVKRLSLQNQIYRNQLTVCHDELRELGGEQFRNEDHIDG